MSETCNKRHFRNRSSEKKILNTLNGKAWTQGKRFPRTWLWLIEYSLVIFWIEYWLVVEHLEGEGTWPISHFHNLIQRNTAIGCRSSWSWTNRAGLENVRIDTSILNGKAEPAPNSTRGNGSVRLYIWDEQRVWFGAGYCGANWARLLKVMTKGLDRA